ncbi:alpha-ketoglutarate-dependent dioxygenase AlkB [Jannaschia sp. W003]|uniref:alpha-ketoglutarate-dependent dioxygenase AlkB n=1 Tax=Jannaschia sp. W003 TaxID=2867012 RepID=UPI0021A26582|nr:alpha-ketoglutarate-dependent dioxygenase AlkB [Jannaschia sp. W003]UWQ22025.1 alpha-ketoglutarate-dependent dioxygenase AlkB [Jannaschia sp. W003]
MTGGKILGEETEHLRGVRLLRGTLDRAAQEALVEAVRVVIRSAPLVRPVTRRGQALSVRMTAAGAFGWVSDRRGYRYEPCQADGRPWPPIPALARAVWDRAVPEARAPECCLVNWYDASARMGLHQDRDEADLAQPVVSISLGEAARFRVGNLARGGPTESTVLRSGDVAVLEGPSRMLHHGVDRIVPGDADLLGVPGRINLTLRVVTA